MDESFLQEQLRRIRAMTARIAGVKSYVSEISEHDTSKHDSHEKPRAHPARKPRVHKSGPLRRLAEQV
jgi:hypothetical protein